MGENPWNKNNFVLELPNEVRRNNAGAAGAGANVVEPPVAPAYEWRYNNENRNRVVRNQIRREQQQLRNRARSSSRRQLLNYHVGRPNENYKLEGEARGMNLTDENIEDIRREIQRMRAEDPELVARQAANNALAEEVLNQNNNREINQNQVGGKRRRRRSSKKSRKSRKSRKQRKTRARKH